MTGKEIVKALRCCAKGLGHDDACENCKVGEIQDRREYIEFAAANVIERLTAENAALEKQLGASSKESVLKKLEINEKLRELDELHRMVDVLPPEILQAAKQVAAHKPQER